MASTPATRCICGCRSSPNKQIMIGVRSAVAEIASCGQLRIGNESSGAEIGCISCFVRESKTTRRIAEQAGNGDGQLRIISADTWATSLSTRAAYQTITPWAFSNASLGASDVR